MRNVHLHGALGAQFGRTHRFDIANVQEAMQALCANYPSITKAMRDGYYKVVVGKSAKAGTALDERQIIDLKLGVQDLHIVPVTRGRGSGGLGKVLAGLLLIGLAFIPGGAAIAATAIGSGGMTVGSLAGSLGAGLLMTGVAAMLAPEQADEDENKSYTMTGPTSSGREGGIVPIAYGEVYTGGVMIAASLNIETTALSGTIGGQTPPNEDDPLVDWISGGSFGENT